MKQTYAILFLLAFPLLLSAENMQFVTTLSSPVGTFAQLETADPTTMAKAPVVNFCNTKTSVGSIALNGANSYIQRLNIKGGSTLGGNIKEFRVQNTMQINTDTSVKGGLYWPAMFRSPGLLMPKAKLKAAFTLTAQPCKALKRML